jgi:Fe-S-cluster containining protein
VDRVDTDIFFRTYFMDCMTCSYCHDSCCQYGADVEGDLVPRVMARAADIEAFTGVLRDRFWRGGSEIEWTADREFPGGRQTRTRVEDGACVFRGRTARGCMLHSFALAHEIDYHEVKPLVCSLFPVTFDGGLLHPSNEIADGSLQCIDDGPTLYRGVRAEIEHYFGAALVAELDMLEKGQFGELAVRAGPK